MSNTKSTQFSRRALMQLGIGGGAAAAVAGCAVGATPGSLAAARIADSGKGPKNIIFLVSDGMSMGALSIAEEYSHRSLGKKTAWAEMMRDAEAAHGYFDTSALDALVTDSAAAATAWGSGTRVFNGAVNQLPDGTKLDPIHHTLHDAGYRTGLVTTATSTHATPAGFAASVPSRGQEDLIALQYLNKVDVVMGGGQRNYYPDRRREDSTDVRQMFLDAGYAYWESRPQLFTKAAPPRKLLGLFSNGHIPYEIDRLNDPELRASVPSLAEMTEAALRSLVAAGGKGFMLQVEGARVDHAAHAQDTLGIIWDQLAFDDAVRVALDFAARDGETLVIVSSDHGNSNPGLVGYNDADAGLALLFDGKGSFAMFRDHLGEAASPSSIKDTMKHLQNVEVTDEEAEILADAWNGESPWEANSFKRSFTGLAGQILGNHTKVQWVGNSHTQDYTVITAKGPGQQLFSGLVLNTDYYHITTGLFGIDHKNPSMTIEQARRVAYARPRFEHFGMEIA